MSKRGHFIINGSPRIIINQLIRAEGIYYKQEIRKLKHQNNRISRTTFVDIISRRGVWIRFELDKKKKIWLCMKRTPKIPLYIFLEAIGFHKKTIYNNFIQFSNEKHSKTDDLLYQYIPNLEPQDVKIVNQNIIFQKFLDIGQYELGQTGRRRINERLQISTNKTTLTPVDFLHIAYFLLESKSNQLQFDDIDNLKNRRLRTVGELLQLQLSQCFVRLSKVVNEKSKKSRFLSFLFTSKPLNAVMQEFFGSCSLSQFLDQINPLAELTHKRRISYMGPNGIKKESAGMDIRSIHSTYFGRICPIETPEGQNAGLVNSLTIAAKPNHAGFLNALYFKVYKGQLQPQLLPKTISLTDEQQVTIINEDQPLSSLYFLKNSVVSARQNYELSRVPREEVQFKIYHTNQLISIATSIIPFLEHNDANRVLMGSNMQRQSIPLLIPEHARIRNKIENRVIPDIGGCIQCIHSGLSIYTSKTHIEFYSPLTVPQAKLSHNRSVDSRKFPVLANTNFQKTDPLIFSYLPIHHYWMRLQFMPSDIFSCISDLRRNASFSSYSNTFGLFRLSGYTKFNRIGVPPSLHFKIQKFELQNFTRTNQGTFQLQKPILRTLEWIHKGDLIVDCAASQNTKLALGRNLMVAYAPWEGLNYEDAIILNENLIFQNKFTSLHIEKYEIELQENLYGKERFTRQIPNKLSDLQHLDKNGIIRLGCLVQHGTILVGKMTPIESKPLLPHEKLLYDIVGKTEESFQDTSLRVPKNVEGRIMHISINRQNELYSNITTHQISHVCIYIAEKRNLKIGDKLSGRHGNKGVISKILPNHDLPFLLNGKVVDIVLNPLGVPSRMNVGQLFECLLGFVSGELKQDYQLEIFDEKYGFCTSQSLVYWKLYETRKHTNTKWCFSHSTGGKMILFDGRTGEKFHETVTVGRSYILKLIHLVDEKMHARSTGPYSLVTQQPLKGRSKFGGQRFGEMEVWALEGFGSAYILQELLTIKSDDTSGRQQISETIINNGDIRFGTPESFKVLVRELQALCLNVQICQRTL